MSIRACSAAVNAFARPQFQTRLPLWLAPVSSASIPLPFSNSTATHHFAALLQHYTCALPVRPRNPDSMFPCLAPDHATCSRTATACPCPATGVRSGSTCRASAALRSLPSSCQTSLRPPASARCDRPTRSRLCTCLHAMLEGQQGHSVGMGPRISLLPVQSALPPACGRCSLHWPLSRSGVPSRLLPVILCPVLLPVQHVWPPAAALCWSKLRAGWPPCWVPSMDACSQRTSSRAAGQGAGEEAEAEAAGAHAAQDGQAGHRLSGTLFNVYNKHNPRKGKTAAHQRRTACLCRFTQQLPALLCL